MVNILSLELLNLLRGLLILNNILSWRKNSLLLLNVLLGHLRLCHLNSLMLNCLGLKLRLIYLSLNYLILNLRLIREWSIDLTNSMSNLIIFVSLLRNSSFDFIFLILNESFFLTLLIIIRLNSWLNSWLNNLLGWLNCGIIDPLTGSFIINNWLFDYLRWLNHIRYHILFKIGFLENFRLRRIGI